MSNFRDIAQRCGVSIASVSRALHDDPKIKPETKDKILKAAMELGYNAAEHTRSRTAREEKLIGILIYDYENTWYMMIAHRLENILSESGYKCMVMFNTGTEECEARCINALANAGAACILFNPVNAQSDSLVEYWQGQGVTFFQLVSTKHHGIPNLCIDDAYGETIALRYLFGQGYRRVLFVTPGGVDMELLAKVEREFCLPEDAVVGFSCPQDIDLPKALLAEMIRRAPDAVLVRADRQARAVIQTLRKMNLSFPRDIGLIVYDDLPWVNLMNITAIAHSLEVITETAARCILHNLLHRQEPPLSPPPSKPYLIERGSAIKPRKVTKMKIPSLAGNYINVYRPQPDVYHGPDTAHFKAGEKYDEWVCNDFSIINAESAWHLIGITHPKPQWFTSLQADLDIDHPDVHEAEWQLFHAVSKEKTLKASLYTDSFYQAPQILPAPQRPNERHEIWAPICWARGDKYYLIYAPNPMRLAISDDLNRWEPCGPVFFSNEDSARDPNIMERDGSYTLVYIMGRSLWIRQSSDLKTFTEPRELIHRDDDASMESPILKYIDGWYYLFYCIYDPKDRVNGSYDYRTYVHAARTLDELATASPITHLRAHAPELFQDEDGDWYIASVEWPYRGVSIAPIKWE